MGIFDSGDLFFFGENDVTTLRTFCRYNKSFASHAGMLLFSLHCVHVYDAYKVHT